MPEKVYTFDRQSMRRISAAVQKSEGVKDRKGNKWYPTKNLGRTPSAYFQFGRTEAEWEINTFATITRYRLTRPAGDLIPYLDKDGKEVTFTAFNMFANVKENKMVGCCFEGEVFSTDPDDPEILILVSAECD